VCAKTEGEFVEKTNEKCPICGVANIARVGKPEGPEMEVCSNCGVLVALPVRIPSAFMGFLKAYFEFCGYNNKPEEYHAVMLSKQSVDIVRGVIDQMEERDKAAIVDRHDLRNIFEKTDPDWLKIIDKDC